jgi:hypothetical protein
MGIQVQEALFNMPNRQNQKRTSLCHITVKTLSIQNKERILKSRKKEMLNHISRQTYKNNSPYLNRNSKSQDGMKWCTSSPEKKVTANYCIQKIYLKNNFYI